MDQNGAEGVSADQSTLAAIRPVVARRARIRAWWHTDDPWDDRLDPRPPVGFAFSGGGIRSATFCLGLIQGMAKCSRDALSRIDILSTVSGGGYAGCFLRSLFVPLSHRGIAAMPAPGDTELENAIADQYAFARATLTSAPSAQQVRWRRAGETELRTLRNPMWWLREHSRYLAPNGPTDFSYAIAYIARNWLAMVYIFALACTAIATTIVALEAGVLVVLQALNVSWTHVPFSPLFVFALAPLIAIIALVIAYWGTQAMSTNEPDADKQFGNLMRTLQEIGWAAVLCVVVLIAAVAMTWWLPSRVADKAVFGLGRILTLTVVFGIVGAVIGAITAWRFAANLRPRQSLLTADLRSQLTTRLSFANQVLLLVLAAGAIDSLGKALEGWLRTAHGSPLVAGLLPLLAYLIKKLPDWFGGTGGSAIGGLLKRFATSIALVVGVLLYGLLAVAAMALVHRIVWPGMVWTTDVEWPRLALLAGLTAILTVLSGRAEGFINLSSLHSLYSARLTRAYLGAGNVERLAIPDQQEDKHTAGGGHVRVKDPVPVNENHARDYIQPRVYGELDLPAPIHIINVTINETIDLRSQIVARDRKGDILTLEPGGVRIGKVLTDWSRLTNDPPDPQRSHAENVSLGQWIAISGAAASSGMGRLTSLGFALAFTFANVRLGYWWWAPKICEDVPETLGFQGWLAKYFGPFVYLANEMTCRYSRGYDRKYLTDGGHYENTGAYALIRRRVPLVIVSDNGADPDFSFDDLETLVRQVRIDLGGESTILAGSELSDFLVSLAVVDRSIFVDPDHDAAWQTRMKDVQTPSFVLVVRVTLPNDVLHVVWIKPRMLPNMPADVVGYAAKMPLFPQQSTGNQFFDEAQWESYRRLGEEAMNRLLAACPRLLA